MLINSIHSEFLQFDDGHIEDNVVVQRFVLRTADLYVPGVMWRRTVGEANGAKSLVLLQHGGSGHKQDENTTTLAHHFVKALDCVAVAIDGPVQGERQRVRRADRTVLDDFRQSWIDQTHLHSYVDEWTEVIKALAELEFIDKRRIGWCGVSMGTAYGLPLLSAVPAISTAIFGKWSVNKLNSQHLLFSAAQVQCPVLFIHHWDDERFDLGGSIDLFSALGCEDKRMVIYRGPHNSRTGEEIDAYVLHLSRSLVLP